MKREEDNRYIRKFHVLTDRISKRVKKGYEEYQRRRHYRAEFIQRNEQFQKIGEEMERDLQTFFSKEIDKNENSRFEKLNLWAEKLFPHNTAIGARIIMTLFFDSFLKNKRDPVTSLLGLWDCIGGASLSSIEIVFNDGKDIFRTMGLEDSEPYVFSYLAERLSKTREDWKADREGNRIKKLKGLTLNPIVLIQTQ